MIPDTTSLSFYGAGGDSLGAYGHSKDHRADLKQIEAEAEGERNERQAIIAALTKQLARGDKVLIGNSAYRRYLRRTPSASGKLGPTFEIDPGKLAEEARYDGLFVLRTNARITPLQACCATAICCKSKTSSAVRGRSSGPARSITPQMPPSVAMCSARSSP